MSCRQGRSSQRGVALFVVLFALMLLSALGIGLLYTTDTDTVLASDYRDAQQAYYEARAGLQEAMARLAANDAAVLPTLTQVVYIINKQNSSEGIQPWTAGTSLSDTELCHESLFSSIPPASAAASCTSAPTETNWYRTTPSTGPGAGTASALRYKWVRVNLKLNASASPAGNQSSMYVDPNASRLAQVYWDGTNETTSSSGNNPVYVVTALAIVNGTRRMVQAEVSLPVSSSSSPFKYAMFATSNACDAINMSGAVYTDSYDSTPAPGTTTPTKWTTKSTSGGDIATFGNVTFSGSTQVNGTINVPNLKVGYQLPKSACTGTGPSISYSVISSNGGGSCVPGYGGTPGPCPMQVLSDPVPPTPPTPSLLPPGNTISYDWRNPDVSLSPANVSSLTPSGNTSNLHVGNYKVKLTGGTYNLYDVLVNGSGTLTLQPGTYNINSLTLTGGGKINIDTGSCASTAPGGCAVILNIAGGTKNLSGSGNSNVAIDLSGGTFANNTLTAGNFQLNYGGTKATNILAGTTAYMAVNSPNSKVTLSGNGQLFGAVIGSTIVNAGSANVHYDKALGKIPGSTGGNNGSTAIETLAAKGEVMY